MFFLSISVFFYLISFFSWIAYVRNFGNLATNFFYFLLLLVSLITLVYFVSQLFKKFFTTHFEKVFDLVVISANVVLIVFFGLALLLGIGREKIIPVASHSRFIKTFFGEVSEKNFFWFFAGIWCFLAPLLTVFHFICKKGWLVNKIMRKNSRIRPSSV